MPLLLSYLASVSNQHLELSQLVKQRAPDFCLFLQHQKTSVLQATQLLRGLPDCCFFLLCFNNKSQPLGIPFSFLQMLEGAQFDRSFSDDFFQKKLLGTPAYIHQISTFRTSQTTCGLVGPSPLQ